jgi:hypothetical protein
MIIPACDKKYIPTYYVSRVLIRKLYKLKEKKKSSYGGKINMLMLLTYIDIGHCFLHERTYTAYYIISEG